MELPEKNPIKLKMNPVDDDDKGAKEHLKVMEAEVDLLLKGPVGYAFEKSFTSLVNEMIYIHPHETEKILGAHVQLRGLLFAHGLLKEMLDSDKIRQDTKRREQELE